MTPAATICGAYSAAGPAPWGPNLIDFACDTTAYIAGAIDDAFATEPTVTVAAEACLPSGDVVTGSSIFQADGTIGDTIKLEVPVVRDVIDFFTTPSAPFEFNFSTRNARILQQPPLFGILDPSIRRL